MGIFADFINSRPMRIQEERLARRELEALRDQGDTDAPGGFAGRTGWAILKVLTLTDLAAPPTQGDLIGFLPQDIDYQRALISPDTARVIANQIAIDDGNRELEEELHVHLSLCESKPGDTTTCAPQPEPPAPPAPNTAPFINYSGATLVVFNTPGQTRVFSDGDQMSVGDNEQTVLRVRMRLSGGPFQISLSGGTGLTFTIGGVGQDFDKEFSGTITDINNAMDAFIVHYSSGSSGEGQNLTVTVNDDQVPNLTAQQVINLGAIE